MRRVSGVIVRILFVAAMLAVSSSSAWAQAATRVVVLADSSSAMREMTVPFREGLQALVDGLPADAEIMLISTGGQLRVRTQPTLDREQLRKTMGAFGSDTGGNAVVTAIVESDKRFLEAPKVARPVMVILTVDSNAISDGAVERYNEWLPGFARRGGVAYGVIVRQRNMGLPSQIVENVAANTRGKAVTIATANGVAAAMTEMASLIAARK